jgi:hypothetical protein
MIKPHEDPRKATGASIIPFPHKVKIHSKQAEMQEK